MSKELDRIIEAALNSIPGANQALQSAKDAGNGGLSFDEVQESAKLAIRNVIYDEIYEEKKAEIVKAAQEEIDRKAQIKQLNEIKILTISGAILALFVGLLVNQLTELILYYKGPIETVGPSITWKCSAGFLGISMLITIGWFFQQALKVIKDFYKNN